jgi:hypothetical protein
MVPSTFAAHRVNSVNRSTRDAGDAAEPRLGGAELTRHDVSPLIPVGVWYKRREKVEIGRERALSESVFKSCELGLFARSIFRVPMYIKPSSCHSGTDTNLLPAYFPTNAKSINCYSAFHPPRYALSRPLVRPHHVSTAQSALLRILPRLYLPYNIQFLIPRCEVSGTVGVSLPTTRPKAIRLHTPAQDVHT